MPFPSIQLSPLLLGRSQLLYFSLLLLEVLLPEMLHDVINVVNVTGSVVSRSVRLDSPGI